jgi:hypothetical protein
VAAAVLFFVSLGFPIVAAFVRDTQSWPQWWGVLDVSIAFVLVILAFTVSAFANGKVDSQAEAAAYRAYRVLTHSILGLLVVFFLVGDRIIWSNCLTGFPWRYWLLLYSLPAWFAALKVESNLGTSQHPREAG